MRSRDEVLLHVQMTARSCHDYDARDGQKVQMRAGDLLTMQAGECGKCSAIQLTKHVQSYTYQDRYYVRPARFGCVLPGPKPELSWPILRRVRSPRFLCLVSRKVSL